MYKVTLQSNTLVTLPSAATLIARGVSALKATAAVLPQRRARPTREQAETKRKKKRRRLSVHRHTGHNSAS